MQPTRAVIVMNQVIERLARIPDVDIEPGSSSWTIRLSKLVGLQFEIQVPRGALEWFAAARDEGGAELWSDWMDYVGYVPECEMSPERLAHEMGHDVEWFVTTLVGVEGFRASHQPTSAPTAGHIRRCTQRHLDRPWEVRHYRDAASGGVGAAEPGPSACKP